MRRPPHAPFRAGAPGFTPALRPIAPDAWLTPDTEAHVLDWKRGLLDTPKHVFRQALDAAPAASEAARAVAAALDAPVIGDLVHASRLVSDDLVVMTRGEAGWVCEALTLTGQGFLEIDGTLYEYGKNIVVNALVHGLYNSVLLALSYIALQFAPESAGADGAAAVLVMSEKKATASLSTGALKML